MAKRKKSLDTADCVSTKRPRIGDSDHLSRLSDELRLRILSLLDVPELIICQKLSRRLAELANDSQLWKALYYIHFVRPRAARIPGISEAALLFSSRAAKWLDDRSLIRVGVLTDWKAQYRLRRNWTTGSPLASGLLLKGHMPPVLPLIRVQDNYAVAVDPQHGLRAWRLKGRKGLVVSDSSDATHAMYSIAGRAATALCLNSLKESEGPIQAVVGVSDGSWSIHTLDLESQSFKTVYEHPPSSDGAIAGLAYAGFSLVTLSGNQHLCAYNLRPGDGSEGHLCMDPKLLCSLKSHTAQAPLSVSLRPHRTGLFASVAFMLPSYSSQWSVGIQEFHIALDGDTHTCRMSIAISTDSPEHSPTAPNRGDVQDDLKDDTRQHKSIKRDSQPASLSYNHPYLLIARPDNTLMLHLVKSSRSELSISAGHRLWGHTSSISDAQVGERGRAISTTSSGDELRIWDLEGALPFKKKSISMVIGTPITSRLEKRVLDDVGPDFESIPPRDHRVIGFDQEKIVTMRENTERALIIYDFS